MNAPSDRDGLLKSIDLNFDKLIIELRAIPLSVVDEQSLEGHAKGTQMSVANLAAYLVGWNELVLKWLDRDAAGEPVDLPETGFRWNELGRLAQKFYHDYEDVPYPQLIERLEAAKGRIVSLIEAHSNDDLYGRPWYGKWTMGRMIQFNTSSPYANARGRLRKWLKTKSVA
ncbi:ClbS/DfsB family four-helix bundle protein [Jiella pacifica]|uniref:ClbS/DfsB family four-helix bundle protein n=1 Tax=Jiella pacifica TaxID=2696469 RepID=A0A6N9T400_9HYPH|nr:ClbS/DfsB family four-helix bundle protein [Jiella pacifica]NDW04549.1 ClbS/DfsB family four-helix bundle protein [Jiella pacifica]